MQSIETRFLDKYTTGHASGCWEWMAYKDDYGYGYFRYNGKMVGAHRASWMLFKGKIPKGLFVCHKCDNPGCVYPEHLFIGTNQDNMDDKVRKNRQHRPVGEKNGRAKITKEIAERIKIMQGSHQSIGDKYGLSQSVVSRIKSGEAWV